MADVYVICAITDCQARRATAFVVEHDRPGLSDGKLEQKLGVNGSPVGEGPYARREPHRRRGAADADRTRHA